MEIVKKADRLGDHLYFGCSGSRLYHFIQKRRKENADDFTGK